MAVDTIKSLIDEQVFTQLDKVQVELKNFQDGLGLAADEAIKFNVVLANSGIGNFQKAATDASGGIDNLTAANGKFTTAQREVTKEMEAAAQAIRNKIIAESEENEAMDAVIKKLVQLRADTASTNADIKAYGAAVRVGSAAVRALGLDIDVLTKRQQLLKSETTATMLSLKTLSAETAQVRATAQSVLSPYQALSKELEQAKLRAKDLAIVFGAESEQALKAAEAVQILNAKLVVLDKSTGDSRRVVGEYERANVGATEKMSAFGAAISRVTNLSNIGAIAVQVITRMLIRMVAFAVIFKGVEFLAKWIEQLDMFTGRLDEATQKLKAMNSALASGETSTAIQNIEQLTEDIRLAKEGFLDKTKVLKEYNDKLGATLGYTEDLDKAEAQIIKHGEAYIQVTLLKAAAQLALQSAAKAMNEAAQLAMVSPEEAVGSVDNTTDLISSPEKHKAALRKMQAEAVADKQKEADLQKSIFENFRKQAAKIAKDNKIDFFDGTEDPSKDKKGPKDKGPNDELALQRARLENAKFTERLITDDQKRSFAERLDALKNYTDIEKKLVENERLAANAIPGITGKRRQANNVNADTQDKQIDADSMSKMFALQREAAEEVKKQAAAMRKFETDFEKQAVDDLIESQNKQLIVIDTEKSKELESLADKYARRKVTKKQYEDQLYAIDAEAKGKTLQLELDTLKKIRDKQAEALKNGYGSQKDLTETDTRIAKAQNSITDLGSANTLHTGAEDVKKDLTPQEKAELEKKALEDVLNATKTVYDGIVKAAEAKTAHQVQLLSEEAAAEKRNVESGVGTAKDKQTRTAQIDAAEAAQKQALQDKENQLKKKAAIADKVAAASTVAINTLVEASKVGAQTGIFGLPLEALVIAEGIAREAAIVATPIPAYAKGTRFAKGGLSLVGEEGTEYIIDPSGKSFMSPKGPSLVNLEEGSQVFTHRETLKMLMQPEKLNYVGGESIDIKEVIAAQRETTAAIKGLQQKQGRAPGFHSNNDFKEYLKRNGVN